MERFAADLPFKGAPADALANAILLAVLGDSISQSYHDNIWFPPQNGERGGALRSRTFQWTEVLAQLRGEELDLGPLAPMGTARTYRAR